MKCKLCNSNAYCKGLCACCYDKRKHIRHRNERNEISKKIKEGNASTEEIAKYRKFRDRENAYKTIRRYTEEDYREKKNVWRGRKKPIPKFRRDIANILRSIRDDRSISISKAKSDIGKLKEEIKKLKMELKQ